LYYKKKYLSPTYLGKYVTDAVINVVEKK